MNEIRHHIENDTFADGSEDGTAGDTEFSFTFF